MPNFSKDQIGFHLEAESASAFRAVQEDEPFRIALLGDFSGHIDRAPVAARTPVLIDRDNFDEILEMLEVSVELPTGQLGIGSLEHFHPDHIYSTYSAFRDFRATRAKLRDPDAFAEARDLVGEKPATMPRPVHGLLDLIVSESGATAKEPARPVDDLQDFIDNAMRPHLVAKEDPLAPAMIRKVDNMASDLMRAVLSNAKFQAIEAAWRTVHFMVRRLETGPELKVYLIDITKDELAANIEEVYQLLMQGSEPWAVVAGNYSFGLGDLRLLGLMGKIASRAQAPFLAEADGSLLEGDPNWKAFRQTTEAAQVGLALPRVLVRMPYGKETVPCETFDFEEISGLPDAKRMLFGSPAYFVALLIGEAFQNYGWKLRPGIERDILHLPVYTYEEAGETKAFPCAEIELTQETAEALMDEGFIPMAAIRNNDIVRVVRFQSIANPSTPLPGRWQ